MRWPAYRAGFGCSRMSSRSPRTMWNVEDHVLEPDAALLPELRVLRVVPDDVARRRQELPPGLEIKVLVERRVPAAQFDRVQIRDREPIQVPYAPFGAERLPVLVHGEVSCPKNPRTSKQLGFA